MAKKKHPGGRPTAYKPEYSRMAQLCIEDSGFSMYKLAKLFDVSRSTIYRWMEEEKEFSDGVEKGRCTWEGLKIHQSLVKRAVGFTYTETTKERATNMETGEAPKKLENITLQILPLLSTGRLTVTPHTGEIDPKWTSEKTQPD